MNINQFQCGFNPGGHSWINYHLLSIGHTKNLIRAKCKIETIIFWEVAR